MEMLSDASSTLAISTNLIAGRTPEQFDERSDSSTNHAQRATLPSKTGLTDIEAGFFVGYAAAPLPQKPMLFGRRFLLRVPLSKLEAAGSCFIENIAYPLAKDRRFA